MLQLKTPPVDQLRAAEPKDSASARETCCYIILRNALYILQIPEETAFFRQFGVDYSAAC